MVGSRVYVGGLPHGVRERDLERFFKGYGRTRDILIKNGYGFVEFEDYRDADDAVYELNGKEILGERVTVEPARGTARGGGSRRDHDRYGDRDRRGGGGGGGRYDKSNSRNSSRYGPPQRTEYRLTVENLSSRVSWQDLKDYMRQAGEVTYADAHKQRKNEGVVEFATSSDMKTAIDKLDDTELNGRRIRLVEDRGSRNGGGRNGRGRSRSSSSRSRSRSRRRSRSRSRSRRSSRSRSKSRSVSKSKKAASKSPEKSRSRSLKRDSKSKSRSRSRSRSAVKRDASRSRSRSKSERRSHSRSKSKDNKSRSRSRSPRSHSRSRSRSRDRSHSQDKRDKSRSASPSKNNDDRSPDRNNESNED